MSIALAVACLICSMVLVVRSFNHLNERYNTYKSPYNINAIFVSLENVDPELLTRLRQVDGITQSVLYRDNWSLKFYESDNPDFLSEEKSRARSRLKKAIKPSMFLLTCMVLMMQSGVATATNTTLTPAAGNQKEDIRFFCWTGLWKTRGGDPICAVAVFPWPVKP